jgi:hypothetical protein
MAEVLTLFIYISTFLYSLRIGRLIARLPYGLCIDIISYAIQALYRVPVYGALLLIKKTPFICIPFLNIRESVFHRSFLLVVEYVHMLKPPT